MTVKQRNISSNKLLTVYSFRLSVQLKSGPYVSDFAACEQKGVDQPAQRMCYPLPEKYNSCTWYMQKFTILAWLSG